MVWGNNLHASRESHCQMSILTRLPNHSSTIYHRCWLSPFLCLLDFWPLLCRLTSYSLLHRGVLLFFIFWTALLRYNVYAKRCTFSTYKISRVWTHASTCENITLVKVADLSITPEWFLGLSIFWFPFISTHNVIYILLTVLFSTGTMLYRRSPELFHLAWLKNLHLLKINSLPPHPPSLEAAISFSISLNLVIVYNSHKWNHIVFVFLCLVYFT